MIRPLTLLSFLWAFTCYAQLSELWQVNPFNSIGFTENQGRYSTILDEEVQFYADDGIQRYYFSNDAFIVGRRLAGETNEWDYFKVELEGASSEANCLGQNLQIVKHHFLNEKEETIRAAVYQELIYENIYPGIDLCFNIHPQGGLKYTFKVDPGANPSLITLLYSNVNLNIDGSGNLKIQNAHQSITDQAPVSFSGQDTIATSFELVDKRIKFNVGNYDKTKLLVIDPWYVDDLPTTIYTLGCFEIAADDLGMTTVLYNRAGSDEVYGFDEDGVLIWMWDSFNSGDVDMNPLTGYTYVSDYFPAGCRIFNESGVLVESLLFEDPPGVATWRIRYNATTGLQVFGEGGGGIMKNIRFFDDPTDVISEFEIFSPKITYEACALLEIDPDDGSIYFLSSARYTEGEIVHNPYENRLYKLNALDPSIVLWDTYTGHVFKNSNSTTYATVRNGVNGIACGSEFVYTYDGNTLYQFNKATGLKMDSLIFDSELFSQYGIDTDACDYVYVGANDSIIKLDPYLNYVTGYELTGPARDLVIKETKMMVCGEEYVTQIDIDLIEPEMELTVLPALCGSCSGSAMVATESCAGLMLESVVWSPGGPGVIIDSLCSGWYVATANWIDIAGDTITQVDSVFVGEDEVPVSVADSVTFETCPEACNGSVYFNPVSGVEPYTYSFDGAPADSGWFDNLCQGTYAVEITDGNGCIYAEDLIIGVGGGLSVTVLDYNDPTCYGFGDGSITVGAIAEAGEVTYEWIPENPVDGATHNNLEAGFYTVIGSDELGCIDTLVVELTDPDSIWVDLNVIDVPCYGDSTGMAIIDSVYNAQGDLTNISFFWEPNYFGGGGVGVDTAYGMPIGNYSLIVNDDFGCSYVLDFSLTEPEPLVFSELGFEPAFCRVSGHQNGGGLVFAAATGGVADYDYHWLNLETGDSSIFSTWGGLNPGPYQITVTDHNGCELIQIIQLDSVNPIADFTVISAQLDGNLEGTEVVEATFINQSQYFSNENDPLTDTTFMWSLDHPNTDWIISKDFFEEFDTSYVGEAVYNVCLIAFNHLNCTDTICKPIIVHVQPEFEVPNIFSPNGDGNNDAFTFEFLSLGIETFYCQIVNRWGVVVAELNSITDGWDGTDFGGDECPDGVYFYSYSAVSTNDTPFVGQGTVQLSR